MASGEGRHGWGWLDCEQARGWPEPVPRIAAEGWQRFEERAPADVHSLVGDLHHDLDPLVRAARATPQTFLHGDWNLGNLGERPDGRTVPLDWSYPGAGPVAHDLAWYLALNRARLPESKEASIDALGAAQADRGIPLEGLVGGPGGSLPARRPRAVRLGEGAGRRRRAGLAVRTGPRGRTAARLGRGAGAGR